MKFIIAWFAVVLCASVPGINAQELAQKDEIPVIAFGVLLGNVPTVVDFPPENVFSGANFLNGTQEEKEKILEVAIEQFFDDILDPFWRIFFIMASNRDPMSNIHDFDEDYHKQFIDNLLSGKEVVCKVNVIHGPVNEMLKPGNRVFRGEKVMDVTSSFHGILPIELTARIMHELMSKLENHSDDAYKECITKLRGLVDEVDNNQKADVGDNAMNVFESLVIANRAAKQPEMVKLIRSIIYCAEMITGSFSRESLKLQNLVSLFPGIAEYMGFSRHH
ncbi:MAG: hypothetical protein LBP31_00785 [Holosporales bacterium]|nr:hypothetical protein [Holosporales bacterium]